ncbi:DUF2946 domain-containing protein [Scandinavium sp.]|uniref:DUF2946 domain-containing protein n=1 Tax=Scandinavium sp. TaxID=2830653 RepID=UPI00289AFA3E|nr:DUF2946 domain-containing protein [Scandinavium sp.]
MNAHWTWQLRFFRRHLAMLLVAFGALVLQSQLALAAHQCDLNPLGDSMMLQHVEHQGMSSMAMKTPLCEKHCVPDSAQKVADRPPVVALPVTLTLAVVEHPCQSVTRTDWSLKPPAMGPPATIRFCRFRE